VSGRRGGHLCPQNKVRAWSVGSPWGSLVSAKGAGQCEEGTECTTQSGVSTCQAAINARCDPAAEPSQCDTERTMCDATFRRCRGIPGKACNRNTPSASDYDCHEGDGTCHVRALADCSRYTKDCFDDYECVTIDKTQVCMLKNGAECNDDIRELKCQEGAKCLWDFEGILRCLQDIRQPCKENLRC
jgi:hypothetical protein